ncbi:glutathione peroxidase [Sphingobacteriaceae bacterium]|nr:glutathione peroxidase [Sphingobacteriaceae bacterium]
MKNKAIKLSGLLGLALTCIFAIAATTKKIETKSNAKMSIYDFKMKTLDGQDLSLSKFKGKKILIVNTASECGYTPQYKNLQALHEKYGNKVVVIGFPANNFGGQEPGSSTEIKSFCTKNYGVTFQMMEKVSVKGSDITPLYKWLSTKEENGTCSDAPGWNFCKYLIDEKGNVVKFFNSKVDPMSSEITSLL